MKPLLATLALALAALVAWFALAAPQVTPPSVSPANPPAQATSIEPDHQAPRLPDSEPITSPSPDSATRTEVVIEAIEPLTAPQEFTASDETGVLFEVKLAGTDQPLPFAIITVFAPEGVQEKQAEELMAQGTGISTILDRLGTNYKCDDKGQIWIATKRVGGLLRAKGNLEGTAYSGMQETEVEGGVVYVRPEAAFSVSVVDLAGVPVSGMRVNLAAITGTGWTEEPSEQASFVTMGGADTDSRGMATLVNAFP
ncbi:MAG: hypothetical protein ACJAVJ_002650, partial [Planctomycetota bacterium]